MKPSVRTLAAVLGASVAMVATSALADDPRGRDRDRDRYEDRDRGRDDRRDWRERGRGHDHHYHHHGKRGHDDRHPGYRPGAHYPAFMPGVHPIWSGDRWVPTSAV